jgi:hypothetical protein
LPLLSKIFEEKDKMWLSLNRESLAYDLEILGGIHYLVADISLLASFCDLLENALQGVLLFGVQLAISKSR